MMIQPRNPPPTERIPDGRIRLTPASRQVRTIVLLLGSIAFFWYASARLGLDIGTFVDRLSNVRRVLSLMLVFDFSNFFVIVREMLVSVSIAVTSMALGIFPSLLFAFLAADNIAPSRPAAAVIKSVVAVVRAVPGLVWILMVVASMGFTNTAATVGLIISTIGYLTKSFVASIEDVGRQPVEALRATGASWFLIVVKGLLPSVLSPFLSWTAIRFETSVAESVSLGMLGVAGIGLLLIQESRLYRYGRISAIVVVIVVTMVGIELVVNRIRRRLARAS